MRRLNAPPELNFLEAKICENIPPQAKHIAFVNPGDGRMARTLRESRGNGLEISMVEPRASLREYLDDFSAVGTNPWDTEWYAERARLHGAFDAIIFYQVHEYWNGEILAFRDIVRHLKENGGCWVTFLNAAALRFLEGSLPPVAVGTEMLTHPFNLNARTDYNAWVAFLNLIGASTRSIWGLLEEEAFAFCRDQKGSQPVVWKKKGVPFKISTIGDSFFFGATFLGIEFGFPSQDKPTGKTKFNGIPFQSAIFQSLMLPYPDLQESEISLLSMEREIRILGKKPLQETGNLVAFFLSEIEEPEAIRSALLLGCGWGKDLLLLKKLKPEWKWRGLESSRKILQLGSAILHGEGIESSPFDPEKPLPYADGSFDIVLSVGYFSRIYPPLAKQVAREAFRVQRKGFYCLENFSGPEKALSLMKYPLPSLFKSLGMNPATRPLMANNKPTEMIMVKVLP